MAITKKGQVIKPETMEDIILQILSTGQELTTNKIMESVRGFHSRKVKRQQLNVHLSQLFKKGRIIRVQKGNGVYIPLSTREKKMNRFRVGQKVKYSLKKDAVGIVEQILFVRGTKRVNYAIKYEDEKNLVHAEGHLLEAVL